MHLLGASSPPARSAGARGRDREATDTMRARSTWLLATCCTASALVRVPAHHVQLSSRRMSVGTAQPLLATRSTAAAPWPATLTTRHRRHAAPRAGLLQKGVAGVVAYTCVSTGWYAVGVSLCLYGLPPATAVEPAPVVADRREEALRPRRAARVGVRRGVARAAVAHRRQPARRRPSA